MGCEMAGDSSVINRLIHSQNNLKHHQKSVSVLKPYNDPTTLLCNTSIVREVSNDFAIHSSRGG